MPAHFGLAKILHQFDKYDQAIRHFKVVIELDAENYKAYCQIGMIYLELQDLERAADYLKKCLKLNPKHIPGMIAMGNLLFESGHAQNAAKYF